VHAGELEALPDDGLAAGLDDAGADEQARPNARRRNCCGPGPMSSPGRRTSLGCSRRSSTAVIDGGQLDRDKAIAWSFVRAVDYWLWGLENGLTIDPDRCERVAGALASLAGRLPLA